MKGGSTVASRVLVLGRCGYRESLQRQERLVDEVASGEAPATLLLCEHEPVITCGRGNQRGLGPVAPLPVDLQVPVVEISRGGGVTYHGPGQVVGYPIVRLGRRDLRAFLRGLEGALIEGLTGLGVRATRRDGRTGVWLRDGGGDDGGGDARARWGKVCSIGIACRRWTTYHGFALNVTTDLAAFRGLSPCGLPAEAMTSLAAWTGRSYGWDEVARALEAPLLRFMVRAAAPRP